MPKNHNLSLSHPGTQDFLHPFYPGRDQISLSEVENAVAAHERKAMLGGLSLVASNKTIDINDIFPPDVGSSEAIVRPVDPSDSDDTGLDLERIFPADFIAEMLGVEQAIVAEHATSRVPSLV